MRRTFVWSRHGGKMCFACAAGRRIHHVITYSEYMWCDAAVQPHSTQRKLQGLLLVGLARPRDPGVWASEDCLRAGLAAVPPLREVFGLSDISGCGVGKVDTSR